MAPTETTLPETEPYVGDGDVVETVPEAGTTVDANTTVDLATNPSPPKVSTRDDQDCDVNNSTATYGDPGDPPYDGSQYPPYQEKKDAGSPYAAVVDPTGTNPAQTSLPLRYGTVAWGWRHILQSHPFTTLDQEQTATALETDSDPTLIYKSTSQWAFHLFYTMVNGQPVNLPGVTLATAGSANPQSVGGSVLCVRTVRVEYYQDPTASELGVLGIRGINDSYVGRYTTG